MKKVVSLDIAAATLRRKLRKHLRELGYKRSDDGSLLPPSATKETYRHFHTVQRGDRLNKHQELTARATTEFLPHFAAGTDIVASAIRPRLAVVEPGTFESELFRIATLTWQIPVSEGFGRRLRFLVWDDNNNKLMGLIALGDPVFNLRVRDELIGWDSKQRGQSLVNVLDAYVLGALPPYNQLLAGKLLACLLKTRNIVDLFRVKYGDSVGIISKAKKGARLMLITTTSALGRSSVYNRLRIGGEPFLESIGFTTGYGHFHVPDSLFTDMRAYLKRRRDPYFSNNRYGQGPSWRLRAIRRALQVIGMDPDLIQHGFPREVFVCKTATNAFDVLAGRRKRAIFAGLRTADEVASLALKRWVIPRSLRNFEYQDWQREDILKLLRPPALSELRVPHEARAKQK